MVWARHTARVGMVLPLLLHNGGLDPTAGHTVRVGRMFLLVHLFKGDLDSRGGLMVRVDRMGWS